MCCPAPLPCHRKGTSLLSSDGSCTLKLFIFKKKCHLNKLLIDVHSDDSVKSERIIHFKEYSSVSTINYPGTIVKLIKYQHV